jgi:hypothetical protein
MNTYGLNSINRGTFNLRWNSPLIYPEDARNTLVTILKIQNLTLNILGYIPGICTISGCVRIGLGGLMGLITLIAGDRNAAQGAIIGHWYDEAILTAIAQIIRGITEAFVPFGWIYNASLDGLGTIVNIFTEINYSIGPMGNLQALNNREPYEDPHYPFIFKLLHLV